MISGPCSIKKKKNQTKQSFPIFYFLCHFPHTLPISSIFSSFIWVCMVFQHFCPVLARRVLWTNIRQSISGKNCLTLEGSQGCRVFSLHGIFLKAKQVEGFPESNSSNILVMKFFYRWILVFKRPSLRRMWIPSQH